METCSGNPLSGIDPILEVYQAMKDQGYILDKFYEWQKRIQIFHVTETGGMAFVEDAKNSNIWWLHAYCPNEIPSDNTIKWLMKMAFVAGCKVIASETKRSGAGRFLERLGFGKLSEQLYTIRAN